MRLETESNNTVLLSLVNGCNFLREVALGDVGSLRVEDVEDELTAGEKSIGDEFACSDSYWGC